MTGTLTELADRRLLSLQIRFPEYFSRIAQQM